MTEITAQQVRDLATGDKFVSNLGELTWREAHAVMYYTANQEVEITLLDGTVVKGKLDETPSIWGGIERKKVWLRQEGRKTRKSVMVRDILIWKGQKAPSLEQALTAYLYLNSGGATREQITEAKQTARMM